MMKKEDLDEIKQEYIENIKRHMLENGGIFSHVALFGVHKNTDTKGVIHVIVEDKHMENDATKQSFVNDVLPLIAAKVKEEFNLDSAAWTSEAWVRTIKSEDFDGDWKQLPIQMEILLMVFQDKEETDTRLFEIKRIGKKINKDGELIDDIELIEEKELSKKTKGNQNLAGRFYEALKVFL